MKVCRDSAPQLHGVSVCIYLAGPAAIAGAGGNCSVSMGGIADGACDVGDVIGVGSVDMLLDGMSIPELPDGMPVESNGMLSDASLVP